MNSLVDLNPQDVLPHGPSKIYVDGFLWHEPETGIVAHYTPREKDTLDHFGLYRGADQIESFGQASVVAMNAFLTCQSKGLNFKELYEEFNFVFTHIGSVECKSVIKTGETFIIIAFVNEYKFRQMKCSGRLYKIPKESSLEELKTTLNMNKLKNYELGPGFVNVSEFNDLIARGIKLSKLTTV
jgi:hypothetical protein